ncbi:27726_t:CDS:2 [Gigaspora margarita]|uniref:27726_t:CDS:1 n=1 Tax=Gigaspora margarita TaxID=4874 RepID=A0ABN7VS82_GIGMA|nr:27726_t:CDS:2 [Gigaspora margarita]
MYSAYIQLALGDGFGITEINNLINKTKALNSYINAVVKSCCRKINESMLSRWFEPSSISLVATFLDPRFKQMSYVTLDKKRETIIHLNTSFDIQNRSTVTNEFQSSSTNAFSFFSSFYDDDSITIGRNKNLFSIETE